MQRPVRPQRLPDWTTLRRERLHGDTLGIADSLTKDRVVPRLRGRFGREYVYADVCDSTQRLLPEDAPEGAVAVADEQLEGRGRLGRSWHAAPGTSVLCSVLLRPPVASERLPELSLVGGRACAAAIAAVAAVEPAIKFPNDVLIGGRKAAGILAEARDDRVVLGIGINVLQRAEELPREARTPPTSLLVETGREIDRADLLVELLARLESEYDAWIASAVRS